MIAFILTAFRYVTTDPFFWPSMAFTVMVGIFIGAVTFNGDLEQIKKVIFSLLCYTALITSVNLSRILPQIGPSTPPQHPFATTVVVILVTLFYLLGMFIGVALVKKARGKRPIEK
jgi:drug/metabolite transporter (DMT)-like permease